VLRRDRQLVYVANPEEERSPDSYLHRTPSRRYVGGYVGVYAGQTTSP
jgi:hypothetical protein